VTDAAPLDQVFCYGTLLPGEERWHYLEPYVLAQDEDQASGRLYDTGLGYPAALFDQVGVIHGMVFTIDRLRRDEALDLLDEIEGAVAGLYHRVSLVTALGRNAYGYQFGGGIEGLTAITHGRWLDRNPQL